MFLEVFIGSFDTKSVTRRGFGGFSGLNLSTVQEILVEKPPKGASYLGYETIIE